MNPRHIARLKTERHAFTMSVRHGTDATWVADIAVTADEPGSIIAFTMKIKHGDLDVLKKQVRQQLETYGGALDETSVEKLAALAL